MNSSHPFSQLPKPSRRRHFLFAALAPILLALCLATGMAAEPALLTTLGETVTSPVGQTKYHYILWQPGDNASTLGKRFGIYSKPGNLDAPGNFTRVGIQTLQASPTTIRALLKLGEKVDTIAPQLPARIDGLYRDVTFTEEHGAPPAADPSIDAATQLSYLITSTPENAQLLGQLFFLGRAHPGVMMALGHAFAIKAPAGITTYEIRELDATDQDIQVLGRVVLDATHPPSLAAPASPIQVRHQVKAGSQYPISAKDHLNARFRWGISNTLKAQLPHTFGFDLFRVRQSTAESLGWHQNPPAPGDLLSSVAAEDPADPDPAFSRVNLLPLIPEETLTPAAAASPNDKETYFTVDDGIWYRGATGELTRRPFSDGESFYYFVAARGITGMPGKISPGTLVQMCDRVPPNPPTIASIVSTFTPPSNPADWASQGGSQFLRIKFRQVHGATATETPAAYSIYRWSSSAEYLAYAGNPEHNKIGTIAHTPDAVFASFDDNGAGAPTLATHTDKAVWYTIRPIGQTACSAPTIGGNSAPASGVLRDFKGPDTPGGTYLITHADPTVTFTGWRADKDQQAEPGIEITVDRTDDNIASALIMVVQLTPAGNKLLYLKSHAFQNRPYVSVHLPIPESSTILQVGVIVTTHDGQTSAPVTGVRPTGEEPAEQGVYGFSASATLTQKPISSATTANPSHLAHNADGSLNPITGTLAIPPNQGVHEWRVYRRVGPQGELTLIARGEGKNLPANPTWTDDALPAAPGARLCYYGQVLDQNANPSPLSNLGCVTLSDLDLPTPMLAPVEVMAEEGDHARIRLTWFCDPVGVSQFQIFVAQEDGRQPALPSLGTGSASIFDFGVGQEYADLSFYPFFSPLLGEKFGKGPGFSMILEVPRQQTLYFAVRAMGASGAFAVGDASNVVPVVWRTPATGPQDVIPWPARPLPAITSMRREIESYPSGQGPIWPIHTSENYTNATSFLVGMVTASFGEEAFNSDGNGRPASLRIPVPWDANIPRQTPESWLFSLAPPQGKSGTAHSLMPFIIYRYQLPSAAFPDAVPNLVQCTPLLDRMSWKHTRGSKYDSYYINDPYFRFLDFSHDFPETSQLPLGGPWDETTAPTLGNPHTASALPPYLRGTEGYPDAPGQVFPRPATGAILVDDPLPVTTGARYQYIFVTFHDNGEIRQVLPLDPVQH